MIRIDAIWLATEPLDMRAGADTILEHRFAASRKMDQPQRVIIRMRDPRRDG